MAKMGRPTKYDPAYCQQLIDFMKGGNSLQAFAAKIKVDPNTITNWCGEHEDFFRAKKEGLAHLALYYENMGKAIATGQLRRVKSETPVVIKDQFGNEALAIDPETKEVVYKREYEPVPGNATSWIFLCKNMLGWRDKKDIEVSGKEGGPINFSDMSDDQVKAEIDDIIKQIKKLNKE